MADATGGPVDVLGHSYGALCALEATALTAAMRRLVLYEPPLGAVTPPEFADRMAELLAQGRREEVVIAVLRELAGMSAEQLELAMAAALVAGPGGGRAHRRPRNPRGERIPVRPGAVRRAERADAPAGRRRTARRTCVASTTALAAALPGARVVTMAGQGHVAMLTAPDLFAAEVLGFLRDGGPFSAGRAGRG